MKDGIKKPELLCPAGDLVRLKTAVDFGADAVYLGGKEFGMRASPANFTIEELREGTEYAHQRGVKVYVTCNTVMKNDEIDRFSEYLVKINECGVDAVIVSDIGAMSVVKRTLPDMDIHISTQAGIVNYVTACELYDMGAKRVILARELSLEDIKRIRKEVPQDLEIETFVHGAMCVSFSGRCLLSNYLTGRDSNRGECAQPCRWTYHLVEEKRPGQYFNITEEDGATYILNSKDMSMIDHIDDLVEAGICSLKIEGRAKTEFYVATVTNAYRNAIDAYFNGDTDSMEWISQEVYKMSHRQYCTGFFYGQLQNGQYYDDGGYVRDYEYAARVEENRDGVLVCRLKNHFKRGAELEMLAPGIKPYKFTVKELYDGDDLPIDAAIHPDMIIKIPFACDAPAGSIIRMEKAER